MSMEKYIPIMNPCPTGATGPPGVTGSTGLPGRQNSDYIFDNKSVVLAATGNDATFKVGDMNAPAATVEAILPLVSSGVVECIHMLSGSHNVTLSEVTNLTIVNWGPATITSLTITDSFEITFLDVIVTGATTITTSDNISFKASSLADINCTSSARTDIRDCTITQSSATGSVIQLLGCLDFIIQSNTIIATTASPVIDSQFSIGVLRDNLIRAPSASSLISDSGPDRVQMTHNTLITSNGLALSEGNPDQQIYNNSVHNLGVTAQLTEVNTFNHTAGFTTQGEISNIDMGTRMNGLIRRTLTSSDGATVQLNLESPSVILILATTAVLLPDMPSDGMIIETIAEASHTIQSNGPQLLIVKTGQLLNQISVAAGVSTRLQYSPDAGAWIVTSLTTII